MRVLITGAKGMLAYVLAPVLEPDHQVTGVDLADCDVRDPEAVRRTVGGYRPELVMHLAAYTDVDGCELNGLRAKETNGEGTRNIAQAAKEFGAAVLYVSTDYVFDGHQAEPYGEDAPTNPLNAYGLSKLEGELYLQAILDRYFIVRTSWLYGPMGRNFVGTILELAQHRRELQVVDDQRGSPTYTRHLASKLAQLARTEQYGVYHVSGQGSCTWFEFAQAIVNLAGLTGVRVVPVASSQIARPARRPANSVLENRRLTSGRWGLIPHWREGLRCYLEELGLCSKPLPPAEPEFRC
jgi:dTDP-4-dehydrorhamnose reductase